MTDKIAIFLTVLASGCLGMYLYYNETNTEDKSDSYDTNLLSEIEDISPFIEEKDIFERKPLRKRKRKSVSNLTRKKY